VAARRDAEWPWRDHYKVLGVEPSASGRKMTSAYRRLVRTLNPDFHPGRPAAGQRFAEVVDMRTRVRTRGRR
jgi:DnaJ-class molecular chaperone